MNILLLQSILLIEQTHYEDLICTINVKKIIKMGEFDKKEKRYDIMIFIDIR